MDVAYEDGCTSTSREYYRMFMEILNKLDAKFEVKFYMESDGIAIVHTHFDCPICEAKEAGTDYLTEPESGDTFFCKNCCAEFEVIESDGVIKLINIEEYLKENIENNFPKFWK